MTTGRHRTFYGRRRKRRPQGARRRLKPGADPGLKAVLERIGTPVERPFRADPFQREALETIARHDCLVTAPTGSGKTWIAEKAILRVLEQGRSAWYATPLKALSNAKYEEFAAAFGRPRVGILTGDRKENPDAPVIVGTTEILRNQLYDAMGAGRMLAVDLVVLDEAHFLGDAERGVVWEEVMIYLPARVALLMLSATVGNAPEISAWLSQVRGQPCRVVTARRRPVPLFPLFLHPTGTLMPLLAAPGPGGRQRVNKKVAAALPAAKGPLRRRPQTPPLNEVLEILQKFHLLPAIFFLKSRADCDLALEMCRRHRMTETRRRAIQAQLKGLVGSAAPLSGHAQMWHLLHLGLGAHHSGQLPAWKLVIEKLMSAGMLDAVFATATVAAGVNFPARTVVLLNSDRYNGTEFLPLTASEFHQMTGRAGRRGKDRIGFALVVPGRFMDTRWIVKLTASLPSDVFSQIRINFSMVLNLLLSHTPPQIEDLLERSYACYLMVRRQGGTLRRAAQQLQQDFARHLDFLKEKAFVTADGRLTPDGVWASRLRMDQPLLIAEALRLGVLPRRNPALLAAVMAAFVNERQTDEGLHDEQVPQPLAAVFSRLQRKLSGLMRQMRKRGFDVRDLYLKPACVLYAWAEGQTWEQLSAWAEMAEGDIASLVLRTADHLKHLRGLQQPFATVSDTAYAALACIVRSPVDTEELFDHQGLTRVDL